MEFLEVFAIVFSLALLMFLAFRGFSIIIIAPIASLVVILLTQMPLGETLTETYMSGFVNFAKNYYLIFLFSAIFGKIMEDSGAARSIAEGILKLIGRGSKFRVLITIVTICAFLTYGGISVFVVMFAVLPIAKPLFKELDIPWHLFMAAFFFESATFTMTMLPGTPAIQNVIPTSYFGTTVSSGALIGIVGAIFCIAFGIYYLKYALKKSELKGETLNSNLDTPVNMNGEETRERLPHFLLSLFPPIFLLVTLNIFKVNIIYSIH